MPLEDSFFFCKASLRIYLVTVFKLINKFFTLPHVYKKDIIKMLTKM